MKDLFLNYLKEHNIHSETYLDKKFIEIIYTREIPTELNNCLCCPKHSNNIMCYNNINKCKCPCRHFRNLLKCKLDDLNNFSV